MLIDSSAIVLRTYHYNDTTMVVVLLTEKMGTTSFLLRIPSKRKTSGRKKLFQPLSLLQVEWDHHDKQSLQHLRQVQPQAALSSLIDHPQKAAIALCLSDFLYYALRSEPSNASLFNYLAHALHWLDLSTSYANFHLTFLLHLTQFLGLTPNLERYRPGLIFDMQNSTFTSAIPTHPYIIPAAEAGFIPLILRINYRNMHHYRFSRIQRARVLQLIHDYYRLHLPDFPQLKSIQVLHDVFDWA